MAVLRQCRAALKQDPTGCCKANSCHTCLHVRADPHAASWKLNHQQVCCSNHPATLPLPLLIAATNCAGHGHQQPLCTCGPRLGALLLLLPLVMGCCSWPAATASVAVVTAESACSPALHPAWAASQSLLPRRSGTAHCQWQTADTDSSSSPGQKHNSTSSNA